MDTRMDGGTAVATAAAAVSAAAQAGPAGQPGGTRATVTLELAVILGIGIMFIAELLRGLPWRESLKTNDFVLLLTTGVGMAVTLVLFGNAPAFVVFQMLSAMGVAFVLMRLVRYLGR